MTKHLEDMTEPEISGLMTACANAIERSAAEFLKERPLFILLVFNDPKVAQYIANCQRSCVVEALREAADRIEGREDVRRDG